VLTSTTLAERVRWQLDGWLAAHANADEAADLDDTTGGLTLLRLVPDEVVPADGRQLGFWGGDQVARDRADRALARVQGMVGHDAVVTAVLQGGRTPAEQVRWVPWGEFREIERPLAVGPEMPTWPGSLPAPFPARVLDPPVPAQWCDAEALPVTVTGRGEQSAPPAVLQCAALPNGGGRVRAWAGPWAHDVRWWDARARQRCVRWQAVVDCGDAGDIACIVALEAGRTGVEAIYD
jgi:protein ImuB